MPRYDFWRDQNGTTSTLSTPQNIEKMFDNGVVYDEVMQYSIHADSFEHAMKINDRIEYSRLHLFWRFYYRVLGVVQC